jgi:hypothetical protein
MAAAHIFIRSFQIRIIPEFLVPILLTKDEIVQYSVQDPMLYTLLDNKVKAVFDPNLAWLFTCGIARTGTTLTLPIDYNGNIPVPANIVETFQAEAPQYYILYAGNQFSSQAVPIRSLQELSKPGGNIWS